MNTTTPMTMYNVDDVTWIISRGISVLTMQMVFALLETRAAQKAHSINIILKNIMDMCRCSLYSRVGYICKLL